jgi:hypothetical protein
MRSCCGEFLGWGWFREVISVSRKLGELRFQEMWLGAAPA